MSIWGDTSSALSGQSPYAVGDIVAGSIDGVLGKVVGADADVVSVVWDDGGAEAVRYPQDSIMIRRAWPWE